ncbi:hypothetical protein GRZ55_00740 [Chelativorans sp. ZYF759]|uniref:hypothetical protein n=1 Tax=Chelativorans sp. ZYF759 TaxID=2692213 RepID=UPI00145E6E24|nr:hypothetical protein [Chelativorans sp. ZYF759]NMG37760.1 hypothetical protein [Chelativorans sp. ZYF759]
MHVAHECDMDLARVTGMRWVIRLICTVAALVSPSTQALADWPVQSKYFVFDRDTSLTSPTSMIHAATREEAFAIGSVMDRLYEKYRAAGFPPSTSDVDETGRRKIQLRYAPSAKYGGAFVRGSTGFPSYTNFAYLILNIAEYRRNEVEFVHAVAHEMFHTIQYSYPSAVKVFKEGGKYEGTLSQHRYDWIMEGATDAAAFLAAHGIGGFRNDPRHYAVGDRIAGARSYGGPLHMDPITGFPRFPDPKKDEYASYTFQNYRTSSFWRFIATESIGLRTFDLIFSPTLADPVTPVGVLEWVHDSLKRLPAKGGSGRRFPGGLPQAYAEFIAEFADLPFMTKHGVFSAAGNIFDDGTWQAVVFGRRGRDECEDIDLSPAMTQVSTSVWIDRFASTCFRVSLSGKSPASPPPAFEINVAAATPGEENYVCQAVALGSNGVTQRAGKVSGLVSGPGACKLHSNVLYAPRTTMTHQNVILTNVHAAGGSGSLAGTRPVQVRVDFVLGAATASGYMSPSPQSSSAQAAPPAPGAPAASSGASTGKNISINSIQAGAAGAQARHAPPRKLKDCEIWEPACPVIDIAISQYDERFDTITAMGTSLGAGALLVLDGGPRQVDLAGTYGNPQAMAAMAMELAGSEFAEVSLRLRAPEGRITPGMKWDNALIDAGVGIMAAADNTYMHSRGPHPVPGSCLSDPPPSGKVQITDVGEGWIKGTFSTELFENYVQQSGQDPCAVRPSTGQVSGSFTAPYHDVTQPPVDPELAAYQVWAGLPAITWALTDYGDLVNQAVATQRDILRDWEAERGGGAVSGAGGGAGGASPSACAQECFPGVLGCPHLSSDEVERLTPLYLQTLPVELRDMMRQQLENAPPQGVSHILAIGMDVMGCMDGQTAP